MFRSGLLANELGIRAEGIGSKTKRYYWINAFIREFVATIVKGKENACPCNDSSASDQPYRFDTDVYLEAVLF